jgi:cell shape-determining protein MreC
MIPEIAKEFLIKDSITVEGITEDYIWYHASLLEQRMNQWNTDFKKLVNVMEARHKDQLKMLQSVMEENRELKKQLKEKNHERTNSMD